MLHGTRCTLPCHRARSHCERTDRGTPIVILLEGIELRSIPYACAGNEAVLDRYDAELLPLCRWMATLCNSGASPGDWKAALQLACARE